MDRAKKPDGERRRREGRLHVQPGGGATHTPYPQYDVVSADKWQLDWDEKTRRLVIDRVENVPGYRFFTPAEAQRLEALCACVMPQADRLAEERVPIAPWIDDRLYQGEGPGYRYETMPPDDEAYRLGLQGFDETAQLLFGHLFIGLDHAQQEEVILQVAAGSPPGEVWQRLSPQLFFQHFMNDVITHYYAHPTAWAEIGFSGPASPRGHIRLRLGRRDPWEAEEGRPHSSVEIVQRWQNRKSGEAKGGPTH